MLGDVETLLQPCITVPLLAIHSQYYVRREHLYKKRNNGNKQRGDSINALQHEQHTEGRHQCRAEPTRCSSLDSPARRRSGISVRVIRATVRTPPTPRLRAHRLPIPPSGFHEQHESLGFGTRLARVKLLSIRERVDYG
jgi:hypothetical protein